MCGSAIPVLTTTAWDCQWKRAIFDPLQNDTVNGSPEDFVTDDYVGDLYVCAKFGANPSVGVSVQMSEV